MIPLIVAGIGRLFALVGQAAEVIQHALHWSDFRRRHHAEARRHHFRRCLKIQASAPPY
jgi:hypothetical protein